MTQHAQNSEEMAADMPPGSAPTFGDVPPSPFEPTPERLVLSSDEHGYLRSNTAVEFLGGAFSSTPLGNGMLRLEKTSNPGELHLEANLKTASGPQVVLDACVRESWVSRTVSLSRTSSANAAVVEELFRLAELPTQSTVKVIVQAD